MKNGKALQAQSQHSKSESQRTLHHALLEVGSAFLKLGLISFGGPIAHLGYLREEFVHRREWVNDADYGDLVALCQFLPGPSSSQLVFALGMQRAGLLGGMIASLCFTLPSAVLMIAFAYGVLALGQLQDAGWLHGLKLAAVAVVAKAVWEMGNKLCPDRARVTIALGAATVLLCIPGAIMQVGVIAGGAGIGWWLYRKSSPHLEANRRTLWKHHFVAAAVLGIFFLLLVLLPLLATTTGREEIAVFDSFYRSGALVFGGGHVVLPLLRAEVVPNGWVADDVFLAGYGAAQALPGPLFTFAGYLGAVMQPGPLGWVRGVWCLLAVFLPGWLLIGGALPFWHQIRARGWAQAALRGTNAAVVGILLAAFYDPVWSEAVKDTRDAAGALVFFALLHLWSAPPWLVVMLAAAAGQWILR